MKDDFLLSSLFELAKLAMAIWWSYAMAKGMTEAELEAKLTELRVRIRNYSPDNLPPAP